MKFSFPLLQWAQQEELIQSKFLLTFLVIRYLNTFANLSSMCDLPWSHWKWVAEWKLASFVIPCAPSCSAHHPAPGEGLPAPVLRCHPYNLSLSGKRCTCKAEFQGGWWNLGLCLCCKLGELWLMACFAKPYLARKDIVFLFIVFSVCYFAIASACCIIFQCPKIWFLSQMCTLFISSGLLILVYLIVAGIGHLFAIFLICPSVDLTVTVKVNGEP